MHADALLLEDHGSARRRELDQDRDDEQDRTEDHEQQRSDHDVDEPLDDGVDAEQSVPADPDQGNAIDRIHVDPRAHDLQQVGDDLELQVLVLTDLDESQQLVPAAPGQGQEDLVGVHPLRKGLQVCDCTDHRRASECRWTEP